MATRATTLWSLTVVQSWLGAGKTLGSGLDTEIERIADSSEA